MLRRLAQVGGSVVMGAGLEALNRGVNSRTGEQPAVTRPGPSHSDGVSSFEKGDAKLSRLAGHIRPDAEASPLREGVHSFFDSRRNVASSALNVGSAVAQGKVGLKDVSESLEQAKEKVVFSAKVAQVVGHGDIGTADGVRMAGAGARHAGEKALEALTQGNPLEAMRGMAHAAKTGAEGAYASATVSDSGMSQVKGAMDERARHEAQKVLTSAALSTGAGVAAGMINPVLGLAVRTLGGLAVGHQMGEAAGKIHGGSEGGEVGAMRAEFRKIVEEKTSSKP